MAAASQPNPSPTGGAPDQGGAPAGGSQAPASQKQIMLARMYQLCKQMAQEDPTLSAGMQKAAAGIQEAQTALVSEAQPKPADSNPAQ